MDPDAREGYRSGKNRRKGEIFLGYDLHLGTNVRAQDSAFAVPPIIRGMHNAPAGSHKADAGVKLIDSILATGQSITDTPGDRGYSFCLAETWALQLLLRGIDNVIDLHPFQRKVEPGPRIQRKGEAGPRETLWIDGSLFTADVPEPLKKLRAVSRGMSATAKALRQAEFDRRAAYAFRPHSQPDAEGYQRFRGPALAGTVRCPNHPPSMRLPNNRPTTTCTPGELCACGITVTIGPSDHASTRQREVWGTTAWTNDYGRRSVVESSNAELKHHRLALARGFTRVFGTIKNSLLIAFAIVGVNVAILRTWHARRLLPDPWADFLGDPQSPIPPKLLRRARRRTQTLQDLTGAPPG